MDGWVVFMIVLTIGWVITTAIRAHYGYPVEDSFFGKTNKKSGDPALDSYIKKQDQKTTALEERIQVLEKIVTDNYGSEQLSEQINNLNKQSL